MATSDEQFGEGTPYHPDMITLTAADLLRLAGENPGPAVGPCLDEMELARLAEGRFDQVRRAEAVSHLAGCPSCRRQLAALVALLGDPSIGPVAVQPGAERQRWRRPLLAGLAIAGMAAALVLLISPPGAPVDENPLRDPAFPAGGAPELIAPSGAVARPRILTWSRVDGASSYRAILFDSTGSVLFEHQSSDTSAAIPDSVSLLPGSIYSWKVEARTGWDRWTPSPLVRFRIDPGAATPASHIGPPDSVVSFALATARDSLRTSPSLSDSALINAIRDGEVDVREEFRLALAGAVSGDSAEQAAQLRTARRLAAGYRSAKGDDFLLREVDRFVHWSLGRRVAKVWGDSVRIAGNEAYGRDGPRAAIAVWLIALERATRVTDSSGIAGLSGNIGAALARESRPDSARTLLMRAERYAQAVGDRRAQANALAELAGLSEERGDIADARSRYARAIALRQEIGDWRGLAADYNNVASLSRAAGDAVQARRQLEAALTLNRAGGRTAAAATNLVNLASLAAAVGAFGRAAADYREALAAWYSTGDTAEAASALRGLGELNLRRGDYPAALVSFTDAARILDRTGPVADALTAHQRIAAALSAQGQLQKAVDELRGVSDRAGSLEIPPEVRGEITLDHGDLALQLNQYPEAERHYLAAVTLLERAGDPLALAAARHGLGLLHLERNDTRAAASHLESALQSRLAAQDRRGAALTRLGLGEVAARARDTALARRLFVRAAEELRNLRDPVASAAALNLQADFESSEGRPAAAEALYRAALARLGTRVVPEVGWRIHSGLAETRAALGDREGSARALRASIAEIERTGSSLRLPERRSGVFSDKWEVYQRLAALELERGNPEASFAVSEALRAREMAELLSVGRVAESRDTAAGLVAREQDLRRRIAELSAAVEGSTPDHRLVRGPVVARSNLVSREALLQAQAEYSALRVEIRDRAPRHAGLVWPEPVGWRAIAQRLRPDEAMLEYLLHEHGASVYLITRDTLVAVPLGRTHRELARRVDFARGALNPAGGGLDSMWRAPLRQLHRDLIAPVESTGLLAGKTHLIIVPHAELHYLPFAALVVSDGPTWFLVQRYQLSFSPSGTVWLTLGGAPARPRGNGVLALAPYRDRLPASRREIGAIARLGSGVRTLSGSAATEAAFRRAAPGQRVLHLATFGVLNKANPLFSYIDLGEGGGHDGRLEAHEVFGLDLSADLVVLSACQTALGSGAMTDVPAGDDWVGLSRAFLGAGAGNVIASLWAVEDRATGTLMERFYQRYDGDGHPARMLADAQRSMLVKPATAHPYYWAGFEVIGGAGQP